MESEITSQKSKYCGNIHKINGFSGLQIGMRRQINEIGSHKKLIWLYLCVK